MFDDSEDSDVAVNLPRSYDHVLKLVCGRAWALRPMTLDYMDQLVHLRADGGRLSAEDIAERLAAARAENGDRNGAARVGAVAVIPMYGVIGQRASLMAEMSGGTSVDGLREQLREAMADPAVSAVVFDVDSPGGSVDGIPEFAAELRSSRNQKPIVAQVNTLAASAAYWLASSMSEVVATQSGEVGSIGVYAAHEDVSIAMEQQGVKTTLVSAGPYKVEGNPYEPLGEDARAQIQGQVDEFYGMFVRDVAAGRGVAVNVVADGYGGGRTFLAKGALAAGMVDRIATLEETVRRLQPRSNRQSRGAEGQQSELHAAGDTAVLEEPTRLPVAASAAPIKPDRDWNARVAKLTRSRR